MLNDVFYTILKMSIFASAAVIIIIVLRLIIGRRLPKYFCHILWIFVLLRLLIPYSLTSAFSIFNIIAVPETAVSNTSQSAAADYDSLNISESQNKTVIKDHTETETKELTSISKPSAAKVIPQKQKVYLNDLFPWIWLAGLLSLFSLSVYSYISIWAKLKTAVMCSRDYVYNCKESLGFKRNIKTYAFDKISTPIVFGLIKPKIILPISAAETYSESQIRYIITHELVHIKRFDNIIKILWVISLCINWFNPIIWLGFIISQKDMEMSCDEKVLSLYNEDIRSEYASSLINLAAKQNMLFNGGILAFGESNIKSRVKGIMKFKKPGFIIGLLSIIILTVVGLSLLTNSKKGGTPEFDKSKVQDYTLETDNINSDIICPSVSDEFKAKLLKSAQELDKSNPLMGPWRVIYYGNNRVIIYIDSHICAINLDKNDKGIYSILDLRNLKIAGSQGSKAAEMYPNPDGTALVLGTGVYDTDPQSTESLYVCNLLDGSVKELKTDYNLANNKIVWYRDMLNSNAMPWGVLIQGNYEKIYYDFTAGKKVTPFSSRYSKTTVKKAVYINTNNNYTYWYKIDENNVIGTPFNNTALSSSDLKLSDFSIVKINLKTKKEEVLFKIN